MPWTRVLGGQVSLPKKSERNPKLKGGDIVDFPSKGYEAVICPKSDRGKAEVWKMFDEMHSKMQDEARQKIEKLIDEAVREARKQKDSQKAAQAWLEMS